MTKIAVVLGSTRPGRRGELVARWVQETARRQPQVEAGLVDIELLDLASFDLPVLDEPAPAMFGQYTNSHTQRWAEAVAGFDGFVFVTPEYNHSVPGGLKNAIDYLFAEWNNKAAGFVSYGVHGGTRAVEHLRLTLAELKVAGVRSQVALGIFTDFEIDDPMATGVLNPGPHQEETFGEMFGEIVEWSEALAPLRERASVDA